MRWIKTGDLLEVALSFVVVKIVEGLDAAAAPLVFFAALDDNSP